MHSEELALKRCGQLFLHLSLLNAFVGVSHSDGKFSSSPPARLSRLCWSICKRENIGTVLELRSRASLPYLVNLALNAIFWSLKWGEHVNSTHQFGSENLQEMYP